MAGGGGGWVEEVNGVLVRGYIEWVRGTKPLISGGGAIEWKVSPPLSPEGLQFFDLYLNPLSHCGNKNKTRPSSVALLPLVCAVASRHIFISVCQSHSVSQSIGSAEYIFVQARRYL